MNKYIALIVTLVSFSGLVSAKQVLNAKVISVYTHDCCGRGSYTSVRVEGGTYSGGGSCGMNDYFAIATNHPNHDAFVSIALSAVGMGKKVSVYGNVGGCIGPFNRADGIALVNEE